MRDESHMEWIATRDADYMILVSVIKMSSWLLVFLCLFRRVIYLIVVEVSKEKITLDGHAGYAELGKFLLNIS